MERHVEQHDLPRNTMQYHEISHGVQPTNNVTAPNNCVVRDYFVVWCAFDCLSSDSQQSQPEEGDDTKHKKRCVRNVNAIKVVLLQHRWTCGHPFLGAIAPLLHVHRGDGGS